MCFYSSSWIRLSHELACEKVFEENREERGEGTEDFATSTNRVDQRLRRGEKSSNLSSSTFDEDQYN